MVRLFTRSMSVAGLVTVITLSILHVCAATASADTIDFDALDTSGGAVSGVALDSYLASFGVTLVNVTPTAPVGVRTPPLADTNVVLTSNPNYLSQWWNGINGTSFDLAFDAPLDSLSVSIPEFTSGVLVPAWSLTALDAGGGVLGSFGSGGSLEGSPQSRRTFSFTGPGITALRVFSDVQGVAGMGGIPIDDLEFTASTVPEPSALALIVVGLLALKWCAPQRKRMTQ